MDEKVAAGCRSTEVGCGSRVQGLLEPWHGEDKLPGDKSVGTASGVSSKAGEGSRMGEINSPKCADGVVAREAACRACKRRRRSAEAARSRSLAGGSSVQRFTVGHKFRRRCLASLERNSVATQGVGARDFQIYLVDVYNFRWRHIWVTSPGLTLRVSTVFGEAGEGEKLDGLNSCIGSRIRHVPSGSRKTG